MKNFTASCRGFFLGLIPTLCLFAGIWGCFTVWIHSQSAFMPSTVPLAVKQLSLWEYEVSVFGEKTSVTLPELPGKGVLAQNPALIPRELRLLAFAMGEAQTYLAKMPF